MKYLLTIVFLFVFAVSNAQDRVYLETQAYSYSYLSDGNWTNWCDWLLCDLTITSDLKNNRITVDNKNSDVFTIFKYKEKVVTSEYEILQFICRDKDNIVCIVSFCFGKNSCVYIEYSNAKVQYLLKDK